MEIFFMKNCNKSFPHNVLTVAKSQVENLTTKNKIVNNLLSREFKNYLQKKSNILWDLGM